MTAVALEVAFVRVLGPVQAEGLVGAFSENEYDEMQVDGLVPQLASS